MFIKGDRNSMHLLTKSPSPYAGRSQSSLSMEVWLGLTIALSSHASGQNIRFEYDEHDHVISASFWSTEFTLATSH